MLPPSKLSYPFALLLAVGIGGGGAGCGKDSAKSSEKTNKAGASAPAPVAIEPEEAQPTTPDGPVGDVKGKIVLTGKAPEMPLLRRGSDPACDNGEMRAETVTVDDQGGLANVMVRIKPGTVPAWTPNALVVVDQSDCMYRPRVVGGVRGQKVEVHNSDKTTHNVHARHLPLGRRQGIDTIVNRAQPAGITMSFDLGDEPVVKLKCDYHGWMQGYIVVSDNPYFTVTAADGTFELLDAPAGSQTLELWHEYYGLKEAIVEIAADGSVEFNSSFDAIADDPMTPSGGTDK